MVLPFTSKANNTAEPIEPPRILTEEEQILLSIDQSVHEVKRNILTSNVPKNLYLIFFFFSLYSNL